MSVSAGSAQFTMAVSTLNFSLMSNDDAANRLRPLMENQESPCASSFRAKRLKSGAASV
ncbi:hypothetical protein D3C72_1866740 [compost metagenome]